MNIIDNIEVWKAKHLHSMLDNFMRLQQDKFPTENRAFSFSINIDNYTSPAFVDQIRPNNKRDFLYSRK